VLLDTYGGMPARIDQRDPFFTQLDEVFPQGVNWQVAEDGLERPDVPNHESNMPNFDEAEAVIAEFEGRFTREPGLDVAAAAEELRVSLDAVFGGAAAPTSDTAPAGSEPAGTEPVDEATGTTSG
jgi:multiple sugar transport system substrate-binding protein